MSKLSIKRVTLVENVETAVTFNNVCGKYLVKNFTEGDIYVSFDANFNESEAVKIKSNYGQTVVGNEEYQWTENFKTSTIYIKGSAGEVEVQQLCYR